MPHERRRGRPPGSTTQKTVRTTSDYLSSLSALQGMSSTAGLYAAYPKLAMGGVNPYASMANMASMASMYAAANPMYAASLASLGYMAQLQKASGSSEGDKEPGEVTDGEEKKESGKSDEEKESPNKTSTASALSAAHSSFPFMYNPMLYAQSLYAQSLAAANFTLPTGMPTSFSTLAQQQALSNGISGDSDKEEVSRSDDDAGMVAQDLSVKKPSHQKKVDNDKPLNLDMKHAKKAHVEEVHNEPLELTKSSNKRKQMFITKPKDGKDTPKKVTPPQTEAEDLSGVKDSKS